ncbi:MAG: DUF6077 domain-containing protein [Roseburia inulinivorans]
MNSVAGVMATLIVLSILFLLLGNRFFRLFHMKERLQFQWLFGFFLFLAVFAVIDLMIEKIHPPFHVLVYAEIVTFALLGVFCVRWYVKENGVRFWKKWKKPDTVLFIFLILIVLQIGYGMNNRIYGSYTDTSYYNGHAINAIYTDTIFEFDAYTGIYVGKAIEWNDSYPMLIAVLAKCFGMHPLVVVNRVIAVIQIMAVNIVLYEIAFRLSNEKQKVAVWAVGIHTLMSFLCWGLTSLNEYFLWVRMAESKSMLANVYLPMVLLGIILIAQQTESSYRWCILAIIVFSSVSMSLSGIFIVIMMLGAGLLPILFGKRKIKYWGYAVLCVLPGVLMGVVRMLG